MTARGCMFCMMALCAVEPIQTQQSKVANLGKQPVGQEMAAWDNVEGFEFLHDLITPSLDRQAACLSLGSGNESNVRLG